MDLYNSDSDSKTQHKFKDSENDSFCICVRMFSNVRWNRAVGHFKIQTQSLGLRFKDLEINSFRIYLLRVLNVRWNSAVGYLILMFTVNISITIIIRLNELNRRIQSNNWDPNQTARLRLSIWVGGIGRLAVTIATGESVASDNLWFRCSSDIWVLALELCVGDYILSITAKYAHIYKHLLFTLPHVYILIY